MWKVVWTKYDGHMTSQSSQMIYEKIVTTNPNPKIVHMKCFMIKLDYGVHDELVDQETQCLFVGYG